MSTRDQFEQWVNSQPWYIATIGLERRDGEYIDPCINSRWQGWQAYAATLEARDSASVPDDVAVKLARACLWSAFVWNDHNFGDALRADQFDRGAAAKVGITTLEQANEWLDRQEAMLLACPDTPPAVVHRNYRP